MKQYVIVSTYPESGSQNIGDQLITRSLATALKDVKGSDSRISIIWRQSEWTQVKDKILEADAIVFACLAIRPDMERSTYPYLQQILQTKKPVAVIAAGTSLEVNGSSDSACNGFSNSTIAILKTLASSSTAFTNRGALSQFFCDQLEIPNTELSGDVAFYDPRYFGRHFFAGKPIRTIAISDPHNAPAYLSSLKALYDGVKKMFPDAKIVLTQHGQNPLVERFARDARLPIQALYLDKNEGLDYYDDVDLHVGYRVHAHVANLTRRNYSYLLEQDGRGCDYGLTIERKISVPSYTKTHVEPTLKNLARFILRRKLAAGHRSSPISAQLVLALIHADKRLSFSKFDGLEVQIDRFNERLRASIQKLP